MNIGQIARSQQMMYNIALGRLGSSSGTDGDRLAALRSLTEQTSRQTGGQDTEQTINSLAESLMRDAGVSFTEGRTVRQIAKSRMEALQKAAEQNQADAATQTQNSVSSFYEPALNALRSQKVPITTEMTEAMQDLALKDAIGSVDSSGPSQGERSTLIQEQLQNVAPYKRRAALNTMNKVWQDELDRIGSYIQERDPEWKSWGDSFDTSLLDHYKSGLNLWV